MEIASPSTDIKQPNMESDSGDAWYAFSNMQKAPVVELQEVVTDSVEIAHSREETQREPLLDEFESLLTALQTSLFDLENSSIQIPRGLRIWWEFLYITRCLLEDVQNPVQHTVSVKLFLANVMEVLNDMGDILDEIMDANRSRLTAEDQSSANKPWKFILNLFNKVSRFMHDPDKEMASKVSDVTNGFQLILEEGNVLGLIKRVDLENLEEKAGPKDLGRRELDMVNAICKGKFLTVGRFYETNPDAISTTFENGQTALHVAITAGQLRIAKELIARISTENPRHLVKQDESGNTALSFAARSGMMEIAKLLIEKNEDLLTIPDANKKIPVQLACSAGHEDMTHFLYQETPPKFLDGDFGFCLLEQCLTKKMFNIALHLLYSFPKFAIYRVIENSSIPIISTLAQTPPPFFGGNQLAFYRRWMYNRIRVKVDRRSVLSGGVDFVAAQRRGTLVSILPNFLGKNIYDLKLMDTIVHEIINFICRRLSTLDENQFVQSGAVEATFQAIENGILDIVIEITKANRNILSNSNDPEDSPKNMFAWAIANRQEEVAQFIYGLDARMGTKIVFTTDHYGYNLLHIAAQLGPQSQLDSISGAALQLQSEIRWFKAVKGIVPQFFNHKKSKDGKTPSQVFLEEHDQLLKDAVEWMKKTAESSTVVGALIITIMFAVAFTVPGGNDQQTGFPIFLNKTANSSTVSSPTVPFMVFVTADAISLFAASSSVLILLTSRYAYKDFLKSLPVKLFIGISSLFISIAAMMVAFCVALFIMLEGRLWIIIPVTLLAGIPVIIFVLLQFPFLAELYILTFGPGIFDRKKNINLGKGRDG